MQRMRRTGLKIILCKPTQKHPIHVFKEIIPKFIEIHDTQIKCEKEVNLLGITIDEKLRFDKHINNLCKQNCKANKCNVSI